MARALGSEWALHRWRLLFGVLCAAAVAPLWWVDHPPLQDLPQHLAAIRVLHSHGDPSFGFAQYFDVHLMRTQYLAYYFCADILSYAVDVETANRLLVSALVVGTPLSLRALLRALGKDERGALLALPLAYNAHLILGFFNFLAAIPLCFYGLSLAVRLRRKPGARPSLALGLVALACFYMHVVPFALLALGSGLCALSRSPRTLWAGSVPLLPALVAAGWWVAASPAGKATMQAAGVAEQHTKAAFWTIERAAEQAPAWLTDVLAGDDDLSLLWGWTGLWALWAAAGLVAWWLAWWAARLAVARRSSGASGASGASGDGGSVEAGVGAACGAIDSLGQDLSRRMCMLAPAAMLAYVYAPVSYAWIWPIAPRFALLGALFSIPMLPRPPARILPVLALLAALLGAGHLVLTGRAFVAFEREEVGEFDEAVAKIPPAKRVAGLIYDRGSRHVRFSPFIHYVAHYQARYGGAVMFTFADFAQSPFSFRDENRPPRVPPRWEWLPQRVRPARDLGWYDYVLVRGGPGRIARQPEHYRAIHRGERWSVWQRLR